MKESRIPLLRNVVVSKMMFLFANEDTKILWVFSKNMEVSQICTPGKINTKGIMGLTIGSALFHTKDPAEARPSSRCGRAWLNSRLPPLAKLFVKDNLRESR